MVGKKLSFTTLTRLRTTLANFRGSCPSGSKRVLISVRSEKKNSEINELFPLKTSI